MDKKIKSVLSAVMVLFIAGCGGGGGSGTSSPTPSAGADLVGTWVYNFAQSSGPTTSTTATYTITFNSNMTFQDNTSTINALNGVSSSTICGEAGTYTATSNTFSITVNSYTLNTGNSGLPCNTSAGLISSGNWSVSASPSVRGTALSISVNGGAAVVYTKQ